MLTLLWRLRWYLLLGLVAFTVFTLATAPLHWVWRMVSPQLQGLPLQVHSVRGQLFNGKAEFSVLALPELGAVSAQWRVSPFSLLQARADIDLHIEGNNLRFNLPLQVSRTHLAVVDGSGYLSMNALKPLLQPSRTVIEGEAELSGFALQARLEEPRIEAISGRFVHSGGALQLVVDGKPMPANLPMVVGTLGMEGDQAVANLASVEGESLLQAYVQPSGWAGMRLQRRFLDVIGLPWPAQAEADTVIFEASQKIY